MLWRMTRTLAHLLVAALLVASGSPVALAQGNDDPKVVIRQLVVAIYSHDVAAYNRVTTEHPLRARLTTGGSPNPDKLRQLEEDPGSLQIREMRPMLYHGKPIESAATPVGAIALYTVAHGGGPMVVPMVKRADGWKVDVRWWIAGQQMAMSSAAPAPEHVAIRSLLDAMLSLNRDRAAGFLTDARGLDLLFVGAPRSREPSGVLDAAAEEMPLVEIGAGEFYTRPSGRVVEGGSTATRKVLVGLFGPIEMPFVVTRIGGNWRVEPETYFALMMQ
jgi:hypothetical protein